MVECQLPKLDVTGSSPVSRSIFSIRHGGLPAKNHVDPSQYQLQFCASEFPNAILKKIPIQRKDRRNIRDRVFLESRKYNLG